MRSNPVSIDELDVAIADLSVRINVSTCELLVLIREFDERRGYLKWGFHSCADWLHWRCDLGLKAARERVRVSHALKCLPQMSSAFSRGALTYSKVRALTRVASRQTESALIEFAMRTTAARVDDRCRQMRNARPESLEEAQRNHARRTLRVFREPDRGRMTITVELPMEEGEVICRALDKAVEGQAGNGPEFADASWQGQQADALVAVARTFLSGGPCGRTASADHYQIMIHVDQTALTEGRGRSDLPVETVRRLGCDGSVVPIVDGTKGVPLSVGRKQRIVSTAIKRALHARDGGCAFPGCTNTLFVDAHHIRHWSQGGETSLENTMLLCSAHHRLVHEGGYTIRRDAHDRWYFCRPDGRAVPACGYQPADVTDEGLEDIADEAEAPAGVYAPQEDRRNEDGRDCDRVGEPAAVYRVRCRVWPAAAASSAIILPSASRLGRRSERDPLRRSSASTISAPCPTTS
jgi:hypothetical protein